MIDPDDLRRRYIEELEDVNDIAEHYGCSVANIRRVLKKHGIRRGKEFIASGRSKVWNRGHRDPAAKRNRPRAEWWGKEHREKLAEAKRGRRGPLANNWQGGKAVLSSQGYLVNRITIDGKRWYMHRYVATQCLGRALLLSEDVHHVDRDRTNNDPANLIVLRRRDHNRLHRAIAAGATSKQEQIAWLLTNNVHFEVCDAEDQVRQAAE